MGNSAANTTDAAVMFFRVKEGKMERRLRTALIVLAVLVFMAALAPVSLASPRVDSSVIHMVRPGETLYSIARYYGVNMWAIARANSILNPNLIYVGQRLVVPTGGTEGFIHVVKPGETLSRIGVRYGVSKWAIAQANGIYNLNHIWVGQRLLIPSASPAPDYTPPPDGGEGWYGEYYNNLTLTGTPCATRHDSEIDFSWGWGAPTSGVDANRFSVRWTRTLYLAGDTYRFYARVDDGVRVWVDGDLIIDQWHDGAARTFSAEVTLEAGEHEIKVEYYDKIQVARIHVWWESVGGPTPTPSPTTPTPTPTSTPTSTPEPSEAWLGEFYNNIDLEGDPVTTRYDPWIGFEWGLDGPPGVASNHFSVRWTKTIYLNSDTYRFCAMSDDGVRIWVDGNLVLDEWHGNSGVAYCGEHWVESGDYEVEVNYFEGGGNALIYVWWEPY